MLKCCVFKESINPFIILRSWGRGVLWEENHQTTVFFQAEEPPRNLPPFSFMSQAFNLICLSPLILFRCHLKRKRLLDFMQKAICSGSQCARFQGVVCGHWHLCPLCHVWAEPLGDSEVIYWLSPVYEKWAHHPSILVNKEQVQMVAVGVAINPAQKKKKKSVCL